MTPDPVLDMPAPRSLVLRMDITNICNLDCIGCGLVENREFLKETASPMNLGLFEKIADEVFPYLREVALSCEAEPTLHPQFARIMKIIAEKTDHNTKLPVRMTTNATLLTAERLDAIFDSGIFGLAISIDGFKPETFARIRKRGEISKVFEAMDEIVRRKTAAGKTRWDAPRLQINYTLMKSTLAELIPLIEYSRRWELEGFVVTHVYSTGAKDMSAESLLDTPDESDRVLMGAARLCNEYGIPGRFPALFCPEETPAAVSPSVPETLDYACSAPWRMLRIRWNGGVFPCDVWNAANPLGDLQTQSFRDVWMSEKYQELRLGLYSNSPTMPQCINCDCISQDNLENRKFQSPIAHTSLNKVTGGSSLLQFLRRHRLLRSTRDP